MWPDATSVVTAYLTAAQAVPVRWTVPNPRPSEVLVVRRSGSVGSLAPWGDRAAMDVEVWSGEPGASPKPAHLLAASVRTALEAMPAADNPVTDVEVTGVAYAPDPVSNAPRVVLGVTVLLRASD